MNDESLDMELRSLEADMQSNDELVSRALDEVSCARLGTTVAAIPPAMSRAAMSRWVVVIGWLSVLG